MHVTLMTIEKMHMIQTATTHSQLIIHRRPSHAAISAFPECSFDGCVVVFGAFNDQFFAVAFRGREDRRVMRVEWRSRV
jgi:hypothetical protein